MIAAAGAVSLLHQIKDLIPLSLRGYWWAPAAKLVRSPWLWATVLGIFALEKLIPADRRQKLWSRGALEDFGWFWLQTAFVVLAVPPFAQLGQNLYNSVTGGHGIITAMAPWPLGIRIAIAVIVVDFITWVHHWIRHRRLLWPFHAIHHSQRELNQFTDLRFHFVDLLAGYAVLLVPAYALQLAPDTFVAIVIARAAQARLIHANVRTNFGPLRHVLVSPQFHRIHHSVEPRHQGRNFGNIFTVWDRIFGTMYPHYDEYPQTGLPGVEFAVGRTGPGRIPVAIGSQLLYPFRELAGMIRSIKARRIAD
ncbi:MAG: sterol desaturase family protein [Gemmatimonadales bacterium]